MKGRFSGSRGHDEGERAKVQSPVVIRRGPYKTLSPEIDSFTKQMGLVPMRALGDLSEMKHSPEECKEREVTSRTETEEM